jgi:hypothetical protein
MDPQSVLSEPTFSGWIFYVSNLVIVSGYLFASLLITRRKGLAKGMSLRAWLAGLSFFLLCGLTHVELAFHAFFNLRVINLDGTVDWHMLVIHIPQAASIWTFLWAMQLEGAPPPNPGEPSMPLPLEAVPVDPALEQPEAASTNETGPPNSFPYEEGNPEGTVR